MTFARIYLIGSIALFITPFLHLFPPSQNIAYGVIWVLWNLIALSIFQRAKLPLTVPMLCPITLAAGAICFLMMALSKPSSISTVFYWAGITALVAGPVASLIKALQLSCTKPDLDYVEVKTETIVLPGAGFFQRGAATVIDGLLIGMLSAAIFSLAIMAFGAYSATIHAQIGSVPPVLSKLLDAESGVVGPAGKIGFTLGFLAPISAPAQLLGIAAMTQSGTTSSHSISAQVVCLSTVAIVNVLSLLYFALMESSCFQGTIGKMLVGLHVCTTTGARLSFHQALQRNLLKVVPLGSFLSGFIYALFSPTQQGVHDVLTECRVLRKELVELPEITLSAGPRPRQFSA